jgi:hypothetical protein
MATAAAATEAATEAGMMEVMEAVRAAAARMVVARVVVN